MFNLDYLIVIDRQNGEIIDQGFGIVDDYYATIIDKFDENKIKAHVVNELSAPYRVRKTIYPFSAGCFVKCDPYRVLQKYNELSQSKKNITQMTNQMLQNEN